jgi:hypothetical protein
LYPLQELMGTETDGTGTGMGEGMGAGAGAGTDPTRDHSPNERGTEVTTPGTATGTDTHTDTDTNTNTHIYSPPHQTHSLPWFAPNSDPIDTLERDDVNYLIQLREQIELAKVFPSTASHQLVSIRSQQAIKEAFEGYARDRIANEANEI